MLLTVIHKIQTALHRQEMQHNLGWLKEVLFNSTSPSPLGGEGVNQHILNTLTEMDALDLFMYDY